MEHGHESDTVSPKSSIVTYEEQTRGWMAIKAKARTVIQEIEAYSRLRRHLDDYRTILRSG
jgi:hypothetical protein